MNNLRFTRTAWALLAGAALGACAPGTGGSSSSSSSSGASGGGSSGGASSSGGSSGGGEMCGSPVGLQFTDRTEAYGLVAAELQGNRIITPDLDGDGFPDLVVHRGVPHRRPDFTTPQKGWPYRVLMNRPAPGGGRMFVEATQDSAYGTLRGGGGANSGRAATFAISLDADNDGDWDLLSAAYVDTTRPDLDQGDRTELLLNNGLGVFSLAPQLPSEMRGALTVSAATVADVDRDGRADVYVGNWYADYGSSYLGQQNRLLLGVGDGTFLDGVRGSGLQTNGNIAAGTSHRPSYGVTACDVDGNGEADLMTSAYGRQLNQLYLQRGGLFEDVGVASGFASDDGVDFTDNENHRCHCQITGACSGTPQIQCPASDPWSSTDEEPWRLGGNTFSTVCADMDNDADMDIIHVEIAHWWAGSSSDKTQLLRQGAPVDGVPRFQRVPASESGIAPPHVGVDWNEGGLMGAAADLDHDGRQDLLLAFSDYPDQFGLLFHQKPDGTFEELGAAAGMHHACLSGLSLADLDADGDLDVVAGSGTARDCAALWPNGPEVHIYENTAGTQGAWLELVLHGDAAAGTNAGAVGARVTVAAAGGLQVTREMQTGHGHAGLNHDNLVHVGLGSACTADVTVRWPDAAQTTQVFRGLATSTRYVLTQATGMAEAVNP